MERCSRKKREGKQFKDALLRQQALWVRGSSWKLCKAHKSKPRVKAGGGRWREFTHIPFSNWLGAAPRNSLTFRHLQPDVQRSWLLEVRLAWIEMVKGSQRIWVNNWQHLLHSETREKFPLSSVQEKKKLSWNMKTWHVLVYQLTDFRLLY